MADEKTPNTDGEEKPNVAEQAPEGNTAGEEAPPSTVEEQAPSVVAEHLHSTNEPETTDIPSANAPDPQAANPEVNPNAAKAKSADTASSAEGSEDKPAAKKAPAAAKAKKEKAPAVEDKPFAEFIQQDYLPALQKALTKEGVQDLDLKLVKEKIKVTGLTDESWQVQGSWLKGQRRFNVYFPEENIQGQRALSCYEGSKPSTLEPFLIDERKITLDLMVFGVMQRLNAEKWLSRN